MKKILLALQFWAGDKERAMKLARFIADASPRHSESADFLFSARFDCPQDAETIKYVSSKFNVLHHTNRWRYGTGWPAGCNDLWFGTMDYVYEGIRTKRFPDYKAVLTMEADCVPLVSHWIEVLSSAWDEASTKLKAKVVGAFQREPGPHINGNAMFSCDPAFLKWVARDVGGCSPQGGWDFLLAPEFKRRGWSDCSAIRSWWNSPTADAPIYDKLVAEGCVLHHGVKDESLLSIARSRIS